MTPAEHARRLYESLCFQPPEAHLAVILRHVEEAMGDATLAERERIAEMAEHLRATFSLADAIEAGKCPPPAEEESCPFADAVRTGKFVENPYA